MRTYWSLNDKQSTYTHEAFQEAHSALETFTFEDWIPLTGFDDLLSLAEGYLLHPKTNAKDTIRELEVRAAQASGELPLAPGEQCSPFSQALLALAVAHALRSCPLRKSRQPLFELIANSWWLENLWVAATVAVAQQSPQFRSDISQLASECLLESEHVKTRGSHDSGMPVDLSDIWHGHFPIDRDSTIAKWASLLAALDIELLGQTLSRFTTAVAVKIAVDATDIYARFDHWSILSKNAAVAFDQYGVWNKNPLMPVLLETGISMLGHTVQRDYPHAGSSENLAHESAMMTLINDVIDVLQTRTDYDGIVKRWGTWLTRQMLLHPPSDNDRPTDVPLTKLLCALAGRLPSPATLNEVVIESESWEPWTYRCMVAVLASESGRENLDARPFMDEWKLQPEDWFGERGRRLRAHAFLFRTARSPADFGARVLGYSLMEAGDIDTNWQAMWHGSIAMREALEFSTPVPADDSVELSSSDGSNLTRLLAGIGLGMLDIALDEANAAEEKLQAQGRKLFTSLWEATTEMAVIDRFGDDYWIDMLRHLAILRARWAVRRSEAPDDQRAGLNDQTLPTHQDVITYFQSDARQLTVLLTLYERNGIKMPLIMEFLSSAAVNVNAMLETANKLGSISTRRYRIGEDQISFLQRLAKMVGT